MNKPEAIEYFKAGYVDIKQALKDDRIAVITDWSYHTDSLHRDNQITDWQVNNWSNPFDNR